MSEQMLLSAMDPYDSARGESTAFPPPLCERPGCRNAVPPQSRGGGPRKYCSQRCKQRAADERRGKVQIKPAPPVGEPYESARLWLLHRLEQGPVSTLELRSPPWPASLNPAQRVLELRNRQHDVRTERRGKRTFYWLWVDGEPVGRLSE